jgi:hypothetical protein
LSSQPSRKKQPLYPHPMMIMNGEDSHWIKGILFLFGPAAIQSIGSL